MKEIADILAAYESAGRPRDAALATVVHIEGSAYRKPGAHMLVLGDGRTVGCVSGGCLERDVVRRARQSICRAEPVLVRYDTSDEDEIGASTGCGGVIRILIEPLGTETGLHAMQLFANGASHADPTILATVFESESRRSIGLRMLMTGDRCIGSLGDATLDMHVRAAAMASLSSRRHLVRAAQYISAGAVVLLEPLAKPPQLLVFGAGPDVIPLNTFAKLLGWSIRIFDTRSAVTRRESGFAETPLCKCSPAALPLIEVSHRACSTAAIVMTHNQSHDTMVLRQLAPLGLGYIGVLGSRRRTEDIVSQLASEGITFNSSGATLHYPIGLDLGLSTPEGIALAITAEITAVMHGGSARQLRDRSGAIHAEAV